MIETLTKSQLAGIKALDRETSIIKRLNTVNPRTEMGNRAIGLANGAAFEAYWNLTREVFMEEGKMNILVDREMVAAANNILEQNGFHQWMG